jgi:hypothetical protein
MQRPQPGGGDAGEKRARRIGRWTSHPRRQHLRRRQLFVHARLGGAAEDLHDVRRQIGLGNAETGQGAYLAQGRAHPRLELVAQAPRSEQGAQQRVLLEQPVGHREQRERLGAERRAPRLDRAPHGRVARLDRDERLVDRLLRDAGDPDARLSEADTGHEIVDQFQITRHVHGSIVLSRPFQSRARARTTEMGWRAKCARERVLEGARLGRTQRDHRRVPARRGHVPGTRRRSGGNR